MQNHSAASNSSFMSPSSIASQFKHSITPIDGGVMLRIWESAERNETRIKPFLFMLKYRMSSEAEAKKFFAEYCALYQSVLVKTSQTQSKKDESD